MAGSYFLKRGSETLLCKAMKVRLVLLCRPQQEAKDDSNLVHSQRKVQIPTKANPRESECVLLLVRRPWSPATTSIGLGLIGSPQCQMVLQGIHFVLLCFSLDLGYGFLVIFLPLLFGMGLLCAILWK